MHTWSERKNAVIRSDNDGEGKSRERERVKGGVGWVERRGAR